MKKKPNRTRRKKKGAGNDNRRLWVPLGAILVLLICAVSILLYFEVHREKVQEWLHPGPEGTRKELTASELERRSRRIDAAIEDLLTRHGVGPERIRTASDAGSVGKGSFVFKRIAVHLTGKASASDLIRELGAFMETVPRGSMLVRKEISGKEERTTLRIRIGTRVVREVVLTPSEDILEGAPFAEKRIRVAIIIDDIGESLQAVTATLSMGVPFTYSILPGLTHSADAARLIHDGQREVMLHLPMEPVNHGQENPSGSLLTVQMGPEEIRSRVDEVLKQIPYLSGVNNHMGSRFTQDRERMAVVLTEIKKNGLFFIDSLTISDSVAFDEAQRLGLIAGKRDIFLDHVDREQSVEIQIQRLIDLARSRGSAIAICHPRRTTIETLRKNVGRFRSQGVEIVPVSELIG